MPGSAGRRELHAALRHELGTDRAEELIDVLAPLERGELARQSDLLALRAEVARLDARIDKLDARLDSQLAQVRGDLAEVRGDIAKLVPRFMFANLATIFAGTGMMLAAVKLG